MFCLNCGAELETGMRYCPSCGAPRNASPGTVPVEPTPAAPAKTEVYIVNTGSPYPMSIAGTQPMVERADYRWAVWVTAGLYLVLIPGLVANIIFLRTVKDITEKTGVAPRGSTGLKIELWVGGAFCVMAVLGRIFG